MGSYACVATAVTLSQLGSSLFTALCHQIECCDRQYSASASTGIWEISRAMAALWSLVGRAQASITV